MRRSLCCLCLAAACASPRAPATVIDGSPGPKPWTHTRFDDDASRIRFAIVADNAGSQRPGVWEDAMRKLNLLGPELVVSVGDLIEGYSEDAAATNGQLDIIDRKIQTLRAPFFHLPGNHDWSNPAMGEVWKKRYGKPYYHFVYKGVLFLVLNTEVASGLGPEQIAYFGKTLADTKDVRWTLLFMHRPLWTGEVQGWSEMQKLLEGRPHTAFAGHIHTYAKYTRNGSRYITLASTGGGSPLKGPRFGSFDHIAWVTMDKDTGPVVANLMLDGIWDEDVSTEASLKTVRSVEVRASPVFADGDGPVIGTSEISIANQGDAALALRGVFSSEDSIVASPAAVNVTVPAKSARTVSLRLFAPARPADLPPLAAATVDYRVRFLVPAPNDFEIRDQVSVPVVRAIPVTRLDKPITVDGKLDDWQSLPFVVEQPLQILFNAETWKGPEDASFRFGVAQDAQNLYVGVEVLDDNPYYTQRALPWRQDGIEIRLDGRPAAVSAASRSEQWLFALCPAEKDKAQFVYQPEALPPGSAYRSERTAKGFNTEIAVPLARLDEQQGGAWKTVRINIAVDDYDAPGEGAQLWWQPDWRQRPIAGAGTFGRAK